MIQKLLVSIVILSMCISCAQYASPTGGKKDEIPPKVVSSKPVNKSLNFGSKEIELVFDELIESTNLQQELLITPKPEGLWTVKNKGYSVVLKFDTLFKSNTTYTFNFRNGIKDLSEKNPASNLKYIFSTGSKIDSMAYSGTVLYLMRNKPAENITVGLFDLRDTFKLKSSKPYYFIKTDTSGLFNLENLRDGNYKVIAFNDRNNNSMYDDKNEEIAFKSDTLKLFKPIANEIFKVAMFDKKAPKVQKNTSKGEEHLVTFDENLKSYTVSFKNKTDSIPYSYKDKIITFYNVKKNDKDSVFTKIIAIDSSDNQLEYEARFKFREADKKKKERFVTMNIQPSTGNDMNWPLKYEIFFDKPILTEFLNKIKIKMDSTIKDSINIKDVVWNINKTKLTITKPLKKGTELSLMVEKGAFINVMGDSSSKMNIKNLIINEEDYGLLNGKVIGQKGKQKILQLIDENEVLTKEIIVNENFEFKLIKEGTYFVRVIIDEDKNGKWSRGDLEKNLQPESVFFSPVIKIKSNFEINNFDIELK
jgi:uncharacterized protein (DUF2141 family)